MQQPYHCCLCKTEGEMMPDFDAGKQIYFYMFHHLLPLVHDECSDGSGLGISMSKLHYKFVFIGLQMPSPEYIVDVESMDIFPVGWCEANAYNLTPPHKAVCKYMETSSSTDIISTDLSGSLSYVYNPIFKTTNLTSRLVTRL